MTDVWRLLDAIIPPTVPPSAIRHAYKRALALGVSGAVRAYCVGRSDARWRALKLMGLCDR